AGAAPQSGGRGAPAHPARRAYRGHRRAHRRLLRESAAGCEMRARALLALWIAACVDAGTRADTLAPRLVESAPAAGARGVSPAAPLRLTFSEPLAAEGALGASAVVLVEGVPSPGVLADLANPPATHTSLVDCERTL